MLLSDSVKTDLLKTPQENKKKKIFLFVWFCNLLNPAVCSSYQNSHRIVFP